MPSAARHRPVLPIEVLRELAPQPGQTIVDATVGGGGHAALVAAVLGPTGQLIALDRDPTMLARAKERLASVPQAPSLELVHAPFDELSQVLARLSLGRVDGVLADLGFASDQMDNPDRGFSFQRDGPLDMRLDPADVTTAADIVNTWDEGDLADLFYEFGEERKSRRIAARLVEARQATPFATTAQLAELVRKCVPGRPGGIDPATRVFQALRIAVNDEMGRLRRLLEQLPSCLIPGGRAVIISFHSLEDRQVKWAFRDVAVWSVLTKKPIEATDEEIRDNPRARSAKLRAARRVESVADIPKGPARWTANSTWASS